MVSSQELLRRSVYNNNKKLTFFELKYVSGKNKHTNQTKERCKY